MNNNEIKKILSKNNFDFYYIDTVLTTMDEIKKIHNNKNICLVANEQTKGIGRRGNKWVSPKGNAYISLLINYDLDIKNHFIFSATVALSLSEILEKILKVHVKIKWPNDILINSKKISGIISEIITKNNQKYIILGIGINIINSPIIQNYPTTYVNEFNSDINRDIIIFLFLKNFFNKYEYIKLKSYSKIINKFKSKLDHLGKIIKLEQDSNLIRGIFEDINPDGSIQINCNGVKHKIINARILN